MPSLTLLALLQTLIHWILLIEILLTRIRHLLTQHLLDGEMLQLLMLIQICLLMLLGAKTKTSSNSNNSRAIIINFPIAIKVDSKEVTTGTFNKILFRILKTRWAIISIMEMLTKEEWMEEARPTSMGILSPIHHLQARILSTKTTITLWVVEWIMEETPLLAKVYREVPKDQITEEEAVWVLILVKEIDPTKIIITTTTKDKEELEMTIFSQTLPTIDQFTERDVTINLDHREVLLIIFSLTERCCI